MDTGRGETTSARGFSFLCFRVRLFFDTLWSPAGKGLTSWLSFVMSNCEVVTFPLVSLARCGALLYRFLFCVLFPTFLVVLWVCLQFVIVVFPDHTHLLFLLVPQVFVSVYFCHLQTISNQYNHLMIIIRAPVEPIRG